LSDKDISDGEIVRSRSNSYEILTDYRERFNSYEIITDLNKKVNLIDINKEDKINNLNFEIKHGLNDNN